MGVFNIRIYGIWEKDGYVLLSDQWIKGRKITKFPGGGLQWGEGLKDGLIREWREEMGLPVNVFDHIYTTDFFQPSAFDDSQVISIYYKVIPTRHIDLPFYNGTESFYFVPLEKELGSTLSLPIDKVVADILLVSQK